MRKRYKTWKSLAFILLLLLIIAFADFYTIKNPAKIDKIPSTGGEPQESTASQQPSACINPEPLKHVYNSSRLVVLDPCKTVSGTVVRIIKETDGDIHIRFKVDPQYEDIINQANVDKEGGNLVVEIVCAFEVTRADAMEVCSGYENKIPVPVVNDHIAITGQLVLDTKHGWNEIHPVYGINVK